MINACKEAVSTVNGSDVEDDSQQQCDSGDKDESGERNDEIGLTFGLPNDFGFPELDANDIDVYKGEKHGGDLKMKKESQSVLYRNLNTTNLELNEIKCHSVSPQGFLDNNDINATGICIEVLEDKSIKVQACPAFWDFFSEESRHLQACREGVDTRTLVRLAFKSNESGIPFETKDPAGKEIGYFAKLFKSHKKKVEEMNSAWDQSPFKLYDVKEYDRGFKLEPNSNTFMCSQCNRVRGNRRCVKKMCKGCCGKVGGAKKCSEHKQKMSDIEG